MRVECPECNQRAVINKRNRLSNVVTDLYCSCSDAECGHTFVTTLAFKHTLSPSRKGAKDMMLELLRSLPANEQQQLLEQARLSV